MVFTDSHDLYKPTRWNFKHGVVDHTLGQYVDGAVHADGIENFWSLLKRTIKGTYISIDLKHLLAYSDERAFAFNNRKDADVDRFNMVVRAVANRRITYAELIGKA